VLLAGVPHTEVARPAVRVRAVSATGVSLGFRVVVGVGSGARNVPDSSAPSQPLQVRPAAAPAAPCPSVASTPRPPLRC
jgi:hypothetical protein